MKQKSYTSYLTYYCSNKVNMLFKHFTLYWIATRNRKGHWNRPKEHDSFDGSDNSLECPKFSEIFAKGKQHWQRNVTTEIGLNCTLINDKILLRWPATQLIKGKVNCSCKIVSLRNSSSDLETPKSFAINHWVFQSRSLEPFAQKSWSVIILEFFWSILSCQINQKRIYKMCLIADKRDLSFCHTATDIPLRKKGQVSVFATSALT